MAMRIRKAGSAGAAPLSLAALLKEQRPGGYHVAGGKGYEEDALVWIKERRPMIESKTQGLVPFVPYDFQKALIRYWQAGQRIICDKAGQLGATTAVCAGGLAHDLLYRHVRTGVPLHAHIFANKEDVAISSALRKVKTALATARLTEEERDRLAGADPEHESPEIRYFTPQAQNYVRAHAATKDAGRSFAGNAMLIDEACDLDFLEQTWTAIQPMVSDLKEAPIFIVSTYRLGGGFDFFCELVDGAEARGLQHFPMDWTVHPERDEDWKERSLIAFEGTRAQWEQEYELRRISEGTRALNMGELEKSAAQHEWAGDLPIPGRLYAKGVDLAGSGQNLTVHTVADIRIKPAQTVWQKVYPQQSTADKIRSIEELDATWPGQLFLDGTNDKSIVDMVKSRNKVGIHFTSGANETRKIVNGVPWRMIPRDTMTSWLISNLESGRLLVHASRFPRLWEALKTAQLSKEPSSRTKRKGKYPDYFDSLMLSNLPLAKRQWKAGSLDNQFAGVASSRRLSGLIGQRW